MSSAKHKYLSNRVKTKNAQFEKTEFCSNILAKVGHRIFSLIDFLAANQKIRIHSIVDTFDLDVASIFEIIAVDEQLASLVGNLQKQSKRISWRSASIVGARCYLYAILNALKCRALCFARLSSYYSLLLSTCAMQY